ncbi:hypothetical protein IWW38_002621 [Coemansia aciculifera]|uniref:Uncharacterized protein n=1 Tax=Coemansia aciculifera TaxID=417176 RepID=A0ACC1M2R3_9FUNG|nr:hypothetical protein IWW38_002621 [Coemansia aciculifera]
MPQYRIITVDAFTEVPFKGNPAAVVAVPSNSPLDETTMQKIAAEMNISETAFIMPLMVQGPEEFQQARVFSLRWFTPTCEVKLCGHATLAAAHALKHELGSEREKIYFETASGQLLVYFGMVNDYSMNLPVDPPAPMPVTDDVKYIVECMFDEYKPTMQVEISPSLRYMVVYDPARSSDDVARLKPKLTPELVAAGKRENIIAVMVTSKSSTHDFCCRFFGPWCGIDEDPVTGSAYTVLGPFWQKRLGKKKFEAHQCSKRSGELYVQTEVTDSNDVSIHGHAVTVVSGVINI